MKLTHWFVVLALFAAGCALVALSLDAEGSTGTVAADRTPLSCDGKPADFHAERAKKVAREAHDHAGSDSRILDATPAKRSEKRAWQEHRRCLLDGDRRQRIGRYVDRRAIEFERHFLELTYPPGLATLAARRACENGGSYGPDGNGDAYEGGYQFDSSTWAATASAFRAQTGLEPNQSRLAAPREQDIRASIAQTQSSGDPWPNCP